MSDELYQDLILAHSKNPLNFGKMEGCCECTHMQNPLCGDEIELCLRFENGKVADCLFEGFGCSISKAAASILSEEIKGKSLSELEQLIAAYHTLLTQSEDDSRTEDLTDDFGSELGELVVFSGVKQFPTRIRCATLAVEALAKLVSKQKLAAASE